MKKNNKRRVMFSLTEEQIFKLERLSEIEGISKSSIIAILIKKEVERALEFGIEPDYFDINKK